MNRLVINGADFSSPIIKVSPLTGSEDVRLDVHLGSFSVMKTETAKTFQGATIDASRVKIVDLPNFQGTEGVYAVTSYWWGVILANGDAFVVRPARGALESFTFSNGYQTATAGGQTPLATPTILNSRKNTTEIVKNGSAYDIIINGTRVYNIENAVKVAVITSSEQRQYAFFSTIE